MRYEPRLTRRLPAYTYCLDDINDRPAAASFIDRGGSGIEVQVPDRPTVHLTGPWWSRTLVMSIDGSSPIGRIGPTRLPSRRTHIDIPDGLEESLVAFIVWCMLTKRGWGSLAFNPLDLLTAVPS